MTGWIADQPVKSRRNSLGISLPFLRSYRQPGIDQPLALALAPVLYVALQSIQRRSQAKIRRVDLMHKTGWRSIIIKSFIIIAHRTTQCLQIDRMFPCTLVASTYHPRSKYVRPPRRDLHTDRSPMST